jgi:lipopolysaccharide transport protein LptA
MKLSYRILLIVFVAFIVGIFFWAIFAPKDDISKRIYKTLKEQEKRADLSFKEVTFEEVVAGVKYWKLNAKTAMVNKSTGIATLRDSKGTFYKKGRAVLRFVSPAALWDMKKKEIHLDKPIGYDVSLERKISGLIKSLKKSRFSVFTLPQLYKKGTAYWFKANNLSWKFADQKLLCSGGIILNKGDVTGYSERLQGDVGLESVLLEGNPKVVIAADDKTSPITIQAEVFEVISSQDILLARGNPVILWEEAKIEAEDMKYVQKNKVLELSERVMVNYKDIKAWGDSARYFSDKEKIILEGNARAVQADNKLSGEKVHVSLKDQKISVLGRGKAIITED